MNIYARYGGTVLAIIIMIAVMSGPEEAMAQQSLSSSLQIIVYPAKGQPPEKQNMDEGECYAWAQQQTGIDPIAAAQSPAQSPDSSPKGRERLKGAAGGAAAGAAIGAIAGDAGEGAGIGAVAGTMLGGRKARQNKADAQQQSQQMQSESLDYFRDAFKVCMKAREYTVN
ncbi:YMGG-like glycine zipper-containing protein [Desulfopila inferna]|uniref:YMGG-like glycine zipper-containing protein n=1 Tax=Desulfopila inferna TaxID=468528 RepID=UPI0019666DD9|nr:YMGG-like glycine zipper-containing protein [Desulfopila inferna]MBM9604135.1 hypothetical protein [Desulfopila inferna]